MQLNQQTTNTETIDSEPTVFIVDSCPYMRKSVRGLFESVSTRVESYSNANDFLRDYDARRPGCLILDVRIPDMSGLELQRLLSKMTHCLSIIFVSSHSNVSTAVRAMRQGAVDFEKPVDEQVLLERVQQELRTVAKEERDRRGMAEYISGLKHLSQREWEVMGHLAEGKSAKEIARDLTISPRTVEVHRARILTKTGVGSVSKLIVMTRRYQALSDTSFENNSSGTT